MTCTAHVGQGIMPWRVVNVYHALGQKDNELIIHNTGTHLIFIEILKKFKFINQI